MGNSTGKSADGFHFLSLLKLDFKFSLLSNIPDDGKNSILIADTQ